MHNTQLNINQNPVIFVDPREKKICGLTPNQVRVINKVVSACWVAFSTFCALGYSLQAMACTENRTRKLGVALFHVCLANYHVKRFQRL